MSLPIKQRQEKDVKPEDALQKTVVEFLDRALPESAQFFAVPNGGKRTKVEGGIFKATGVKPGVPDLAVIYNGVFHGIELKAGRNKPTDVQKERHRLLRAAGARIEVCWTVDQVQNFLRMYMPLRAALT